MHQYDIQSPSYSLPTEFPAIPAYKELLEARQRRLEEKTRSAGVLAVLKNLESPSANQLPPMRPKYQQPAILKKLNYDFGTLKEFLSYDLKLKKPEELFKIPEKGKKIEVKNKEEDLKKGLMQHMKQDIDNRDAKTILLEEKDPEKVSKAAKKFVGDMMGDIFKDDLVQLEKKIAQKGVGKLYELIMDLEEDNPIRKIAEKYGYKSLADKFNILEAEMEKKKNPDNHLQLANLKKPRLGGIPAKMAMQGFGANGQGDSNTHSPLDIGHHKQPGAKSPGLHGPKQNVQFGNNNPNNLSVNRERPYMLIDEDAATYTAHKNYTSASPKLKKKEVTESEQVDYAVRMLSSSSALKKIYSEYESAEKEQYSKEIKQAEETGKMRQTDVYAIKEKDKYSSVSANHLVFQYGEYKPHFFIHACLKVASFQSLQVLNVRGCNLPESLVWFMLLMVEKFSHDIKMIDISGNQVSYRVCEVIQGILIKHELKILKMASVDLDSKGLALICLGLAKNSSVVSIDFNYNEINEYGFQTLALILRHTKSLQSVKILRKKVKEVMQNGEEKEVEEELSYTAMAALTKTFKYNKYINPKNVQLFESK